MNTAEQSELFSASEAQLFVLDARNQVERRHLLKWLHSCMDEHQRLDGINWICLPISDERSDLALGELTNKLLGAAETSVIPVRIAWRIPDFDKNGKLKKRHILLGDPRAPGSLRASIILKRNPHRAQFLTGQAATISELKQRFEKHHIGGDLSEADEFASFVVRQASLVLDRADRDLRGQRYKVPRHVAAALRNSSKYRAAISKLSIDQKKSESELHKEAAKYMSELIARPSALFIDLKAKLDRFMLSQGYEDQVVYDKQALEKLRETMRDHPTLLLFTHKTYIDGVTPTDLAYQNGLPMLHVFGGINLDLFGLGFILRRAGTIFIRRKFENNAVYKVVLRHYVSYLLEKKFPMTWAFEGTRSRLGKLMPPRYGLLKYVMDSANVNDIKNVHIIPVVTSFDLIRDVEEYASEQTGSVKKPESLSWFVGYLNSLREPMGKVYVDLGEPVVIANAPEPNDRIGLSKIAFEVAVQANRATPLTVTSLMCLALLGLAPRAVTATELRSAITYMLIWAKQRNIRFSDDLREENLHGIQKVIDTLVNNGLLLRHQQGSTTVYAIEPAKHPIASYYRNTIIHHFLDKGIIELSLLKARKQRDSIAADVFWAETERLRDLFKFEFFYPSKEQFRENLEAELTRTDPDWENKLRAGGFKLQSLTNHFQPLVGHAVFMPFVEAYTIVLDILARQQLGQTVNRASCVEAALKEGRQAYLLRRISSEASIGKILFENGYKMAASQEIAGETTEAVIAKRKALLGEFRELSRRMEKSRLEVARLVDNVFS